MINMLYAVLTFLAYLIGQLSSAWAMASLSLRSKLNGINSYDQYMREHGPELVFRFLMGLGIMLTYAHYSVPICVAASRFDGMSFLSKYPIPVVPATALLWGLFMDSALHVFAGLLAKLKPAWFNLLSKEVPPPKE